MVLIIGHLFLQGIKDITGIIEYMQQGQTGMAQEMGITKGGQVVLILFITHGINKMFILNHQMVTCSTSLIFMERPLGAGLRL